MSWGWNVFTVEDGSDFDQILAAFKTMEEWPADDRRPMILVGPTTKGWWPTVQDGKVSGQEQLTSYPSHPYAFKMRASGKGSRRPTRSASSNSRRTSTC